MYAHIFKGRDGFTLIISKGAEINQGVISTAVYLDRKAAKVAARLMKATPWNY
jgi:hypothetical protein